MSRFNTDTICFVCSQRERRHPQYERAVDYELEAVAHGDLNCEGIGAPSALYVPYTFVTGDVVMFDTLQQKYGRPWTVAHKVISVRISTRGEFGFPNRYEVELVLAERLNEFHNNGLWHPARILRLAEPERGYL